MVSKQKSGDSGVEEEVEEGADGGMRIGKVGGAITRLARIAEEKRELCRNALAFLKVLEVCDMR